MYGEVVESIPIDFWTGEPIDGLYIVLKDFLSELDRIQSGSKVTLESIPRAAIWKLASRFTTASGWLMTLPQLWTGSRPPRLL